jgi:hypothetical protein
LAVMISLGQTLLTAPSRNGQNAGDLPKQAHQLASPTLWQYRGI